VSPRREITRPSAKRISIFNHKGGVGKTTLTFNIASALARLGKRVLLVDSDPQCNLTAYLIEGAVVDDLLDSSDDDDGRTIWSAVKPVVEGTGLLHKISPFALPQRNLSLTPGDIRLSDFEAELTTFWGECLQRKVRGYRGTTALSALVSELCSDKDIDFVFYDSGPNIGALNRVILLDCDYFIVPVACDLFSVRALKTLGRTLGAWITEWETIASLAPEGTYLLPGEPKFLGYIPQDFSTYRGGVVSEQARYLSLIDRGIRSDIVTVLKKIHSKGNFPTIKLGEVKDFGILVTASQREGRPIDSVSAGTAEQRSAARSAFQNIAKKIIGRAS
jgi:cellulose biosynthesis protein BcsQ